MLRDLVDRFACRYRLWAGENRGDKVGAGVAPPEISPREEPAWQLIMRFLQVIAAGFILLAVLYHFAISAFPSLSDGILIIFIFLAVGWCSVGLFMMAGELLTKYSRNGDDDKSI